MEIKIFSEKWSPDTTADGAAGIFGLYLMGCTPVSDQVSTHLAHMAPPVAPTITPGFNNPRLRL